jgi:hypothetical protein
MAAILHEARPVLLAGFLFGHTLARCLMVFGVAQAGVSSNVVCSHHCVFPPLLLQTRFARHAIQDWGQAIQPKALQEWDRSASVARKSFPTNRSLAVLKSEKMQMSLRIDGREDAVPTILPVRDG